jgi:hypothetical protein
MSLLEDIIGALERDDPTVTISAEEAAEGVDLRAIRGQGGVGPDDPPQVSWTQTYQGPVAQAAMRRPVSPIPAGYVLNLADNYIPFHIIDHFGREVPAKYVRVHWGNNPSAQARLTSDGATYRGEVHAAPRNDRADPPPPLTYEDLCILQHDNQRKGQVDHAIRRLKDLSLKAEIQRWRGMREHFTILNNRMKKLEDEVYELGIEQRACKTRLENANLMDRLLEEMAQDQRIVRQLRASRGRSV